MEIHAPKAPHSLGEFLRELLTITAGILIALSLEGLLEWNHHRHLVREARENIRTELSENRRELEDSLDKRKITETQLDRFSQSLTELGQGHKPDAKNLQILVSLADLHRTSWNTAANTGAIAYMGYPEVKAYTEIYDLQAKYDSQQETTLNEAASGIFTAGSVFERPTPEDIHLAQQRLNSMRARLNVLRDFGNALDQRYAALLHDNATK